MSATTISSVPLLQELLLEAERLCRSRQFTEAALVTEKALRLDPSRAATWNASGAYRRMSGDLRGASRCYQRALEISPTYAAAWSNLGNALADLKCLTAAALCHRQAIALNPREHRFLHNYGVTLMLMDRHQDAIPALQSAVRLRPDDPKVEWDLARAYLHVGDFAQGWPAYEARWRTGDLPKHALPGKRWRGQNFKDKTLLIVSEQGFGDAIWAARYFSQAKALGGRLIVECRPELVRLFRGMVEIDAVTSPGEESVVADFHCYICSLAGIFFAAGMEAAPCPYLTPRHDRRGEFEDLLGRPEAVLRIGIVWSGSTTFKANADRAVTLDRFITAFTLPGVRLYSLQMGPPRAELQAANVAIMDLSPHLSDFADTAEAVSALDLIIMTDSSVAHLAGALGVPVWLLLNFVPHWLWMSGGTSSAWYPTVTLFRAEKWGDWNGVFDAAANKLISILQSRLLAHRERARLNPSSDRYLKIAERPSF